MSNRAAAKYLARQIFRLGDDPERMGGKTQRLQFMGGEWPNKEIAMGGCCENALVNFIEKHLDYLDQQ